MGKGVYANGMEIAHEAGANKVLAAFPDVCLSPPSPPAGPVPIPYPDTSLAGDLKQGSRSVKIGGEPVALHGQSYYKSSPLGNEAATRSFGASIITHQITGKTCFQASSMDVEVEGKKVNRHLDLTTSNHGSQPGATPPFPGLESMSLGGGDAGTATDEDTCACCGGPAHGAAATRNGMTTEQYYSPSYPNYSPTKGQQEAIARAREIFVAAREAGCAGIVFHDGDERDPCAQHYPTTATERKSALEEYKDMKYCKKGKEHLIEKYGQSLGTEIFKRGEWLREQMKGGATRIAHKTPLSGGGCPIGRGNLEPVKGKCVRYETDLGEVQGAIAEIHRKANGLI